MIRQPIKFESSLFLLLPFEYEKPPHNNKHTSVNMLTAANLVSMSSPVQRLRKNRRLTKPRVSDPYPLPSPSTAEDLESSGDENVELITKSRLPRILGSSLRGFL